MKLERGPTVTAQRTPSIQDMFLDHLRDSRIEVMMFLVNGIRLLGRIRRFDNFTIELVRDGRSQIIYKHAISAINPAEPVPPTGPGSFE
ncbi:RNA chaperone Hfq [Microvirga arabica]|uniref:RNA chaperone Hfq n=1 Tax=Microvirga arabica TaxID=1128671 RepID=UPI001939D4C8|nr:RNA chaperone Hfq [Microvirga arabica]MBM1175059.1 RNA chaperone Hfq [Microvirga arabica]